MKGDVETGRGIPETRPRIHWWGVGVFCSRISIGLTRVFINPRCPLTQGHLFPTHSIPLLVESLYTPEIRP